MNARAAAVGIITRASAAFQPATPTRRVVMESALREATRRSVQRNATLRCGQSPPREATGLLDPRPVQERIVDRGNLPLLATIDPGDHGQRQQARGDLEQLL